MDQLRKLSFDDRLKEKIILLILESLQNSDNTNKTNNLESIYEGATDKSKLNSMSTIHDSKMWSSTHFNFVRVESNDYQKESHFIKKHDLPENSSDNDDSDNEEIDFKDMNNTLPEVNTQRLSKIKNQTVFLKPFDHQNLTFHEEDIKTMISHTALNEKVNECSTDELAFGCSHKGCFTKFKTKRQKAMHHSKLEKECKLDKNNLVRLLGKFRHTLNTIKNKNQFKNVEKNRKYQELRELYHETVQFKIIDSEYFFSVMEDEFDKEH